MVSQDKQVSLTMSKAKPPTQRMLATLRELAKPGEYAIYMPYMGTFNPISYYFLKMARGRPTIQIRGLVKRGLAEYFDEAKLGGDHKVRISAKGRALLRKRTGVAE